MLVKSFLINLSDLRQFERLFDWHLFSQLNSSTSQFCSKW